MKPIRKLLLLVWGVVMPACAQNDSIHRLEELVIVADTYVKENVVGQKTISISPEEIKENAQFLTDVLRNNSPVALRDVGNGGASSARFRGTSASNTGVLWNGINVNAIGNGQTDFNALNVNTIDEIVVKSGGGSVKYGSGAIGGTIHLNDKIKYQKHFGVDVFSSYGSFDTNSSIVKTTLGTGTLGAKLGLTYNKSDNDYDLIDDRYQDENGQFLKNENGAYQNYSLNFSLGYKLSLIHI